MTRFLYLDVTFLRFGGDARGIAQVIHALIRVFAEPEFRGRVRFICLPGLAERHLLPVGIAREDIVVVRELPFLGLLERFHGLASTWRYRRALGNSVAGILHPEARSITRLPVPQAVFWHDLLQVQGRWSVWNKPSRYLYVLYKYARAARVPGAANSGHTRREVIARFGGDPSRIRVVALGARRASSVRPPPSPLSLPLECIYVGAMEPRKNVFGMLENLGAIFGDLPFRLHLVGRMSPAQKARAEALLSSVPSNGSVLLHGQLSDAELETLMSRCDITFFPSLGEGFGLPVAEAMDHGHVVFAFDNTSIPEVAGDGAVLAPDSDFAAWGRALAALVNDPAAAIALRVRARERARNYSAEAAEQRLRDFVRELADATGAGR